ncbi:MAG TPA: rod shape-determining protein MreD [Aggregatilineaceae bacterium]|nr:rod shape-determining protein MreD [Aggregatilineaceae bacterium]
MARYLGIPILALAAILNAAVMSRLQIGGGAPDLVFLVVVSWALLADVRDALLWAVIGGVMQDWMSITPLGASALGLVVVVFVADSLFGQVQRGNLLIPPLVAAGGTLVVHLGILIGLRLAGHAVPIALGLTYVTVPTMIYNAILILPVFRVVGLVYGWLSPRRVRLE